MTLVKFNKRNETPFFNLFDDFFGKEFNDVLRGESSAIKPAVNVLEKPDSFDIEMAVPGMDKSDFTLNIDKNVLTISGEKTTGKEEEEKKYTRREFGFASFNRSFTMPELIDIDNIGAKYENGILHIVLPKKEEAKEKPARSIKIA